MKTLNLLLRSFQTRVTLVLILSMLFIGAMSNFLIYKFALDSQFNQLRDKLEVIAQTAALMVDADTLLEVPLNQEGINTAQYKIISERLNKIREVNPPIHYIYTMTKTAQEGIWQFIVDADIPTEEEIKKGTTSYPGDKYNASRFPEMLEAFDGPSADRELGIDEWGTVLSGYAPIRDKNGESVAVLGVDIKADDVYRIQKEVHLRAIFVLGLGIIFSILLGMLFSKGITNPVKKLVEGTRHISKGDLQYQVEVKGGDEISELARSFNRMAVSLHVSRRRLHNYFYRIVQSLVLILEARDHYTRGHSERVAEYAEKIALKMGFSQEKTELLKETGVLHDIGKLGVQESILNKKEKLTEEEWEMIRRHPVIGEDILKPVLLNPEMLAIVRGHHERYDGKGYPDKLSGQNINIFAQILSVADAYDAMTSPRAYRSAFGKEKAIEELDENRGTQFNPEIVDAFLQVLQEETPQPNLTSDEVVS